MSDAAQPNPSTAEGAVDKGKGKAVEQPGDHEMDEDDSSSEEEEEGDAEPVQEEEDDDNMEEISEDNIISGGRTRGKRVDYQKAAAEATDLPEDDEDEDDDFEEPDQEMEG